jgi:uroporphyrin-III C-methyltransferase/precorrin-2 dehydrogenase/sirohydrochlorin ferrochelatase
MRYLPLHFDLKGRSVLVVGGGELARRKVSLLLAAGASVTLVAPEVSDDLAEMLKVGEHLIHYEPYRPSNLDQVALVVAATDDETVNRQVSVDARAANVPVNVVDRPELCTVTFPAIVDRDPIVVSIGSAGGAPVLVRHVRELIETFLPERIARVARYLADRRERLKSSLQDLEQRRRQTERFIASAGFEAAAHGQEETADKYLFEQSATKLTGEVYVVGAGPGDPDLLTLKALQLMQQANVVLYDNLVSPEVLDRVRRDATREFVGKRSGYKSTHQEDINDLLVRLASEGNRVIRLKGGDPFIFGRGGEEITALIRHQIPFQVVPGITAASGCAAYAGIPLTHRDHARSVRFVTGHPKDGKVTLPWSDYLTPDETLVFYMGLGGLSSICQNLISHGRNTDTPVAIVSRGTTPDQRVLKGTLESITGLVARTHIQTPTLIIIGDVISFAD